MTAFSLLWYAIAGAEKAVAAGLPVFGAVIISAIGPTAGRWYVDVSSGVPPKQFVQGQWFVLTALIAGAGWIILDGFGVTGWTAAVIAFMPAYLFRVIALYYGWKEPLAREPRAAYHSDEVRPAWSQDMRGLTPEELKELDISPTEDAVRPARDEAGKGSDAGAGADSS